MCKFAQKPAQTSFSIELKQQKCHKIWKKTIRKKEICKKTSPKNKHILIKTTPKTSNPQALKKNRKSTKNKPKFGGKPQGRQHL